MARFQILSLAKDSSRREALEPQLQRYGYEYDYFWGFDAVQARTELAELRVTGCRNGLTPNEAACAIGHLAMYRSERQGGLNLILEDDAIPLDVQGLPPPGTIASHLRDGEVLIMGVTSKRQYLAGRPAPHLHPQAVRLDVFSIYMLRGTVAYAFNSATAEAITKLQTKKLMHADAWWHFLRKGAIRKIYFLEYFCHPEVTERNSNIESQRRIDRNVLHRFAIRSLRTFIVGAVGVWRSCSHVRRV